MKSERRMITLSSFEHDLLINGFNEFRNKLIEEDKPIEDVDRLLMRIIDAPFVKEKRCMSREGR